MMAAATLPKSISPPPRYPSGDKRPEPADTRGHSPTLIKRIEEHAVAMGADWRMATVLGRLRLSGVLTQIEFEAGCRYADDVANYERIKGHPPRHSRSADLEFGRKGSADLDLEALRRMDPEAADKVEKRMARRVRKIERSYGRLMTAGGDNELLKRVCCDDQHVAAQHHEGLKSLLSAIARRVYQLNIPEDQKPKPRPQRRRLRTDARDLALGACEAIEAAFERARSAVKTFEISGGKHKARRITAHGVSTEDETMVFAQAIDVPVRIIMPKLIDAQIRKVAAAKGWIEKEQGQ